MAKRIRLDGREVWDGTLPKSVLSDYDLRCIAYSISDYLHNCTGIPSCRPSLTDRDLCPMCGNAMRLVVQAAEPKIIETVIKRQAAAVGHGFIDLHPRCSDD